VLPEAGEYERTSTTVINAYVGPVVERYLGALHDGLHEAGFAAPLLVMQSTGGVMHADSARRRPIEMIESGPAAGVVAAIELSRHLGEIGRHIITVDMGGTTAKASILENGRAFQLAEYEVGAGITGGSQLFKGGGHLLRVPALDIAEVGAGGGSLVTVDAGGGLRVGPASAGAVPGPVCYGLGNQQPTLTDANLVLGYLNQRYLLGGSLTIDAEAARRQLHERVAVPVGLDLLETAYGVHLIAVSNMVRVARAVSTERGRDPRRCALLAFGGNGPVHAAEVARQLGIGLVIIPPWPGLFSAFGLLYAEPRHELVQAIRGQLANTPPAVVFDGLDALERAARARLIREGYPPDRVVLQRFLDLHYSGQSSELRIPLDAVSEARALGEAARRFEAEHQRIYGHHDGVDRIVLVNLRVVAHAEREPVGNGRLRSNSTPATVESARAAYFGRQHGMRDSRVIRREQLGLEPEIGPMIVEEYDATTIVPPGWTAACDNLGNILLQP
jgi:N-methylhydantoinase A